MYMEQQVIIENLYSTFSKIDALERGDKMYPRTEYEMTQKDFDKILDACRPVPCILVGSYSPSGPQENANRAWSALGVKMGFDYQTVRPVEGKGNRFFTAVPSETESQKTERLAKQAEEKRLTEIAKHKSAILEHQEALNRLERSSRCQTLKN